MQSKALFCFDLDGTLYPGNTSMAFYKYLLKIGAISWLTWPIACMAYLSYLVSCKNITLLHRIIHKYVLAGQNAKKMLTFVPEFIKLVVLPKLRMKLLQQIQEAQKAGHPIALLSSSPDFLVKEVGHLLKINLILASTYPIAACGRFSQDIDVIRGENKACWIENFLSLNPSYNQVIAYSDAMEDLPMLLKADVKYAVFPEKSLLLLSLKQGWELILS